jgi:ankyrin repeat protein
MILELLLAIIRGDVAMAQTALRRGADPNQAVEASWGFLSLMRQPDWLEDNSPKERLEAERYLLREALENSDRFSGMIASRTPLQLAALLGEDAIAELLLTHRADPNARDAEGWTPLAIAVRRADPVMVRMFLQQGGLPNTRLTGSLTPLFIAARMGQREIVEQLLKAKADPNITTEEELTPLMAACAYGHLLVVPVPNDPLEDDDDLVVEYKPQFIPVQEMLLEAGADPNRIAHGSGFNDFGTALKFAALSGVYTTTQLLLNKNAEVNVQGGTIATALMASACTGKRLVASLLQERGADVNLRSDDGLTALMCAARYGHADMVRWLLEAGAEPEARRDDGETALAMAAANGHADVVRTLVYGGSNADGRDREGRTALMRASFAGHLNVVRALLDGDASVNLRSNNGKTALGWAKMETLLQRLSGRMDDFWNDPLGTLEELGYEFDHSQPEMEALLQGMLTEMYSNPTAQHLSRLSAEEENRTRVISLLLDAGAVE